MLSSQFPDYGIKKALDWGVRSLKGVKLEVTSKDVFTTQQTGPPGFMCTAFIGPGLAHENAAEGSGQSLIHI